MESFLIISLTYTGKETEIPFKMLLIPFKMLLINNLTIQYKFRRGQNYWHPFIKERKIHNGHWLTTTIQKAMSDFINSTFFNYFCQFQIILVAGGYRQFCPGTIRKRTNTTECYIIYTKEAPIQPCEPSQREWLCIPVCRKSTEQKTPCLCRGRTPAASDSHTRPAHYTAPTAGLTAC